MGAIKAVGLLAFIATGAVLVDVNLHNNKFSGKLVKKHSALA